MTPREFQRKYHDYHAETKQEAEAEAARVNEILEPSAHGWAVPVSFGELGWVLMLAGPVAELKKMGVLP